MGTRTPGLAVGAVTLAVALATSLACGRQSAYPPAYDPGDIDWTKYEGMQCTAAGTPCRDVESGAGPRLRGHGLVTVRIWASDPETGVDHGLVVTSFLYPALRTVVFRGRDRDVSPSMFGDVPTPGSRAGAFLHLHEAAFFGPYAIGMRLGGRRAFRGTFSTTLCPDDRRCFILGDEAMPGAPGLAVPAGRALSYTMRLEAFCYPTVQVRTGFRFQPLGDEKLVPRLIVRECGD